MDLIFQDIFCFLRSAQLLQYLIDEFANFFGRLTGNQILENQLKFVCAAEREKVTTSEGGLPAMFVVLDVFIEKTMQWNDWARVRFSFCI